MTWNFKKMTLRWLYTFKKTCGRLLDDVSIFFWEDFVKTFDDFCDDF